MRNEIQLLRVVGNTFGLNITPATLCMLMNKIFHLYLDQYAVVDLDYTIIYSNTLEEHVEHLKRVFRFL